MFQREARNQIDFGSNREDVARFASFDNVANLLGRAVTVAFNHNFIRTFGMNDDVNTRIIAANIVNVYRHKGAVNRTMTFPQQHL